MGIYRPRICSYDDADGLTYGSESGGGFEAVRAQVSSAMGQCKRQGDAKDLVMRTSTTTVSGFKATNGAGGRREGKGRIPAMGALILGTGFVNG